VYGIKEPTCLMQLKYTYRGPTNLRSRSRCHAGRFFNPAAAASSLGLVGILRTTRTYLIITMAPTGIASSSLLDNRQTFDDSIPYALVIIILDLANHFQTLAFPSASAGEMPQGTTTGGDCYYSRDSSSSKR
jgi:hypothetical protein